MKWPAVAVAVVLSLGAAAVIPGMLEAKKPEPPPAVPTLLAMTDNPIVGAVAISQDGGLYVGQSKIWTRVGSTPSTPTDIWTRPGTGEIFIAMANGDLYRFEQNSTLTFDSNVFTSTASRRPEPPASAPSAISSPLDPETVVPGMVR
jgi:hypothetical protein